MVMRIMGIVTADIEHRLITPLRMREDNSRVGSKLDGILPIPNSAL